MKTVVLSYNFKTEKTLHSPFEGDGCIEEAQSFLESIKDDYPAPDWVHTIVADKAAKDVRVQRLLRGDEHA